MHGRGTVLHEAPGAPVSAGLLDESPAPARSEPWASAWLDFMLLLGSLGLLAMRLPAAPFAYDALVRYQALLSFVSAGRPAPMEYPFIGPAGAVPLWYLGHLLGAGAEWWVMHYNLALFAALLLGLCVLLRDRIDQQVLRSFLLILAAASMFGTATQDFLGEMFTAVLAGLGCLLVAIRPASLGWLALIVGTANTPAAGVGLGLVALKRILNRRRLRYLVVPLLALGLIAADTWFRRHELLVTGYLTGDRGLRTILPYSGRPGFSYPLLFGLLSILFSFGKGLVFYAPGLLLPVWRRLRSLDPPTAGGYMLWLAFLAGLVLVYSSWWAWYGGFTWGPRFFLLASLPASLALAVWLRHPPRGTLALLAVLAILALSCWVGVDGIVYGNGNLTECSANGFADEHLCWYVPEFSALWRPFVAPKASYSSLDLMSVALTAAVFVRLAVPLLEPLVRSVRTALADRHNWTDGWTL